jgi:hypothetical protein
MIQLQTTVGSFGEKQILLVRVYFKKSLALTLQRRSFVE